MSAVKGATLLLAVVAAFLALAPAAWAAPANDDFANALTLSPTLPNSLSGNNTGATKQAGEPDHAGNAGGHSVWFSWTPSVSGEISMRAQCFGAYEALIGIYTGSTLGSLAEVASNAGLPAPSCFDPNSELQFTVSAGTTYRIAIDGRGGWQDSFAFNLSGPPANDDFADAAALSPSLPVNAAGETRLATKQAGEPDHAGDPGGSSVWYSWTPSVNGPVRISTCTPFSSLDTLLAVYTGSAINALTEVASNDDATTDGETVGCNWTYSEVGFEAVAGVTYTIAVDSVGAGGGNFSLNQRGRPANDDFSTPQVLGAALPTSASQVNNDLATKQAGESDHAGEPGGRSLWYSWTPSASGQVGISTCAHESSEAGAPDTVLAVYTGSALNALTEVAANDDAANPRCGFSDSEVAFDAVAGTTYLIAVDTKDGAQGRFDLGLEKPSENDDFADAKTLNPSLPAGAIGSTRVATKQSGEPDHAGAPGGRSVWYSWTPASGGPVAISVCPYGEETPDTVLAVYTGAAVDALTPVAANDDSPFGCRAVASVVKFDAVAGATYMIAVDSKTVGTGMFSIELEGPPANDDFSGAQALGAEPMTVGGSTLFASKQAGEPNHAGQPGGHSLWYSWTPSTSGPVDVSVCSPNNALDTLLAVYTGAALNALTAVASNDDATGAPPNGLCESPQGASEVVFDAIAGTTYKVAVDSKGSGQGRFAISFERAPSNDAFADATVLGGALPTYGNANGNKLASKQAGEPNHAGQPGGHSLWYSWTPTSSGWVSISTCSYVSHLDTLLAVYTGVAVNALTPVAANDDTNGECKSTDSEVELNVVAGATYMIAVDGKGGGVGSAQLIIEGTAPYDEFAKADGLAGAVPRNIRTSNRFATKQSGEPDHAGAAGGHSVWFKWTAPYTGDVSIDTCGSRFDTLLAVYSGSAVNALSPVASDDDGGGQCSPQSRVVLAAVAGAVYRIAVDGKDGAQGAMRLHIDGPPKNDDFAHPNVAPTTVGWWWPGGSTVLATKQAGEPGQAGGHTVWYSWTPKASAAVELEACSEGFEPLLAVYTGAAANALTPVAIAAGSAAECEEGGSIEFAAVAGATYRIVIDGTNAEVGHFELHLAPASVIPPGGEQGGGGSSGGGGGGSQNAAPPAPPVTPKPNPPAKKPLKCKPGFKKVRSHGKTKCVKKPKKGKKHRH